MKNFAFLVFMAVFFTSCQKFEESIDSAIQKTSETVQHKTEAVVRETVDKAIAESINSVTQSQDAKFDEVFRNPEIAMITNFKGKKVNLPTGNPAYIFKYNADKSVLLPFLETQPTIDESKSQKTALKIDGQNIIEKLSFIESLLPENSVDTSFIDEIRNERNVECYKIKRYPNSSTLIYNPKTNQVYQYVEIKR